MITVDKTFIDQYWKSNKKHKNYNNALDVAFHIQFHFDGYYQRPWMTSMSSNKNEPINPYFKRIIDSRRPSESETILAYRRLQYLPITKVPCHKVINSCKKIIKSSDWKIDYSTSEVPNYISDENSLYYYCEKIYPGDDSVENWARKNLVRWMLIDPNAICVVMPLSFDVQNGEMLRPYSHIIQCKDVYDYKKNSYYVFLSPYVTTYKDKNGKDKQGKIITVVTDTAFYNARQTADDNYEIDEYPHNIGYVPAWHLGGELKTPDIEQPFYDSYISGMLPSLDSAARDCSDLDAEKVQHMFSTMWVYQMQGCSACAGTGSVLAQGKQTVCQTCEGRGTMPFSPYRTMELNANNDLLSTKGIPTPPGGYIQKTTTEMVSLMRNEIETCIYDALSAVNMQNLYDEPLNESGKAKEVDRDEQNNFIYEIAYNLVEENMVPIYWFINEMRYGMVVTNPMEREKMLPKIPVPEKFEFLSDAANRQQLIELLGSNASDDVKQLAEMDYIHAEYSDAPEVRNKLVIIQDHDPLPGKSIQDCISLKNAGLVKTEDVILHVYIKSFLSELLADSTDFTHMEFEEQKELLYEMAALKAQDLDVQQQMKIQAEAKLLGITPNKNNVISTAQKIAAKKTELSIRKKERNPLNNA
jgi:hypothetical protein